MRLARVSKVRTAGSALACLVLPILPLSGCDAVQRTNGSMPNVYTFILGPRSGPGADQRLRVTMPRDYLELTPEDERKQSIELGQFSFALHCQEKRRAAREELGLPGVVVFTIAWEQRDGVKRRVDGSWTNRFSRYRPSPDHLHGLRVYLPPEPNNISRLYVSEDKRTIIECSDPNGAHKGTCHLLANEKSNLTKEAVFGFPFLNQWREILQCGSDSILGIEKIKGEI